MIFRLNVLHSRALRDTFDGKFQIELDLDRSKDFKPQKHRLHLAKPWNCGCIKILVCQAVKDLAPWLLGDFAVSRDAQIAQQ